MKVNEYFGGNVVSIAFENAEGRATAGVMAAGEYEFGTSETERMLITSGKVSVQLPGESSFKHYKSGDEFYLEAGVKFQIRVPEPAAYLCFYGE